MSERLNSEKILSFIAPEQRSQLADIVVFDSLPSTNTYLLELARKPLPSGYVCLAEEQTAGRGRQGKSWFSPKGKNIYCSVAWNFPAANNDIASLSLAIGVMMVKTLQRIGVSQGLQLKWPNDIYYQDKKLAGILIETIKTQRNTYPVIMGIGINVAAESGADYLNSVGVSAICGRPVFRNHLAGLMLDEIARGTPLYVSKKFVPFFGDYQRYDMVCGKYVVIRNTALEIPGIAQGINENGELCVRDALGKEHSFRCGEVSVALDSGEKNE